MNYNTETQQYEEVKSNKEKIIDLLKEMSEEHFYIHDAGEILIQLLRSMYKGRRIAGSTQENVSSQIIQIRTILDCIEIYNIAE